MQLNRDNYPDPDGVPYLEQVTDDIVRFFVPIEAFEEVPKEKAFCVMGLPKNDLFTFIGMNIVEEESEEYLGDITVCAVTVRRVK